MGIDREKMNINIGNMKRGIRNSITDVKGVKVGHVTHKEGKMKTGVTAVLPHDGNMFKDKVVGTTYVINGFGKTIGTVQIEELGTIETPIILTNTLSVGTAATALVKHMLKQNDDIGLSTGTVNPVVCECNDGVLNHIRELYVTEEDVFNAIENASEDFEEGAVGGGTGMVCYGLKGGIGTASRVLELDGEEYTIGILVMSNFGATDRLTIDGKKVGESIKEKWTKEDKGSIIILLATDIPVNERQLKRLCKRVPAGLARTGSYYGNGSGDLVVGFTTANKVSHYSEKAILDTKTLHDDKINPLFMAVVEATEEAVISSMLHAETTIGRDDKKIMSLKEYIEEI